MQRQRPLCRLHSSVQLAQQMQRGKAVHRSSFNTMAGGPRFVAAGCAVDGELRPSAAAGRDMETGAADDEKVREEEQELG